MKKVFLYLILFCISKIYAGKASEIINALDEIYKQQTDIQANVTITQQKGEQGTKKTELTYYRRDSDRAFLIVITSPESEKGNGYLRVGENFWMYRKNTRTFQHINRDESIGGSDARGDDFEGKMISELYEPVKDENGNEIISEELFGKAKIPVYKFELRAKVKDVDYPKKIIWVRKDKNVILKEESYSLSGTLMQTAYFLSFTEIKGKLIPVKQLFVDEFEKGKKTIVEISSISTEKLDNNIFTKAYLENLSK
ncbi:MAG: outer membrane lipoprotein-sorting protein [Chitinispirillaceae bacterium]|nr:outer membrane lipoprotein-sorting protein [Chitinispirillaceae bacterium]